MDPVTGSALTSGVIALLSGIFGGGNGGTQMSQAQRILLEESLRNQNLRVKAQNPLYEMATQLAMNLMPRSATPGRFLLPGVMDATAGDVGDNSGRRGGAPTTGRAIPRGVAPTSPTSGVNEAVTRLGRSRLFQMPPTR